MKHALCLGIALAMSATAQQSTGYVDVYIAKVKPEKRTEFDALAKKVAEANRKNNGDNWLTSEVVYGEQNTMYFTSSRANFGAIDEGMNAFEGALGKAFGPAAGKLMDDWSKCLASSRGEVRRFRMDLSSGYDSADAVLKEVSQARMIRSSIVRVRPGHVASFEDQIRMTQKLGTYKRIVSQSVIGTTATTFWITTFGKSMADLDLPGLPQLLGDRYAAYAKLSAENMLGVEVILSKYLPEFSNPPAQVVSASPDFWAVKPAAPAKPKQ